jgi:hypothetical protein
MVGEREENIIGDNSSSGYTMTYFWQNMISNREIEITKEEFENQSQPNL